MSNEPEEQPFSLTAEHAAVRALNRAEEAVAIASAALAAQNTILLGLVDAKVVEAEVMREFLRRQINDLNPEERAQNYGLSLSNLVTSLGVQQSTAPQGRASDGPNSLDSRMTDDDPGTPGSVPPTPPPPPPPPPDGFQVPSGMVDQWLALPWKEIVEPRLSRQEPDPAAFKGDRGGCTFDGTEASVAALETLEPRLSRQEPNPLTFKGDGRGGTFDGMEARLAALETLMEDVRDAVRSIQTDAKQAASDTRTIKVSLATITENIRHIPTTGKMIGISVVQLGIIATLIGLAPKIQSFFGTVFH